MKKKSQLPKELMFFQILLEKTGTFKQNIGLKEKLWQEE